MRILVTGHLGYIGTVMVPLLKQAGHDVVGLDSDIYKRCTFAAGGNIVPVETLAKDVRDVEPRDLAGIDAIVHLAGLSNDPLGDFRPEITYAINHQASVRLARMAKDAGVQRFVFASSCSNYGAAGEDFLDESSAFNPVTPYGESKVLVERDVLPLNDDRFSTTFLRCATACGVSPRIRFDLVLNNLVAWAYTTGQVLLKSAGTSWRPIVHIEDISRAFLAMVEAPRELVHGEAFNVGTTAENYKVKEIAQIVVDTVPGSKLAFQDGASPDKRNYRVNCDKLAKVLPHAKPRWTVRTTAQQLYEAYQRASLRPEDFEGPKYQRIAHIKSLVGQGLLTDEFRVTTAGAQGAAPAKAH
ncbi:MAG: SDR family oxidoreductase [Planctomycetota bacterium]